MTLFLGSLFFLVFNEFFYVNTNLIIFIYIIYITLYYVIGTYVVSIFTNNNFIHKHNIFFFKIFFSKIFNFYFFFKNFFFKPRLIWKPLFKKSSYFGIYRANRNQWLNK